MKRIFTFVLTAVATLCLTACSVNQIGNSSWKNSLGCGFSAEVMIYIDRLEARGAVKRFGEGIWEIEFSEPNTLSGVKLEFSEGNVAASYKGLSFSVPQSAIPVKAMMLNLMKAVEDNAKLDELTGEENEGMLSIKGNLDGGEYILTVDENGLLSSFEMPNYKLKMRFNEIRTVEISSEQSTVEEVTETTSETETITTA